ncbi:MAG: hypothetical protein AAF939_01265 [Planctomycetota bacterium]
MFDKFRKTISWLSQIIDWHFIRFELFWTFVIAVVVGAVPSILFLIILLSFTDLGWIDACASSFIFATMGIAFCFCAGAAILSNEHPLKKLGYLILTVGFLFGGMFPIPDIIYGCSHGSEFVGKTGLTLVCIGYIELAFVDIVRWYSDARRTP